MGIDLWSVIAVVREITWMYRRTLHVDLFIMCNLFLATRQFSIAPVVQSQAVIAHACHGLTVISWAVCHQLGCLSRTVG